jgi:hypothetical protein
MYSDGQSGTGAMATREARELDKEQQKHLGADDAGRDNKEEQIWNQMRSARQ